MNKWATDMMEYAKDAFKTAKPWVFWEWKLIGQEHWHPCMKHPDWSDGVMYRRKP